MPDNEDLRRWVTDMKYSDENIWEELGPEKVAEGERAELERFQKMGVYDYETRAVAMNDELGKFVKVKWVRTNKGTAMDPEVRCRLVAQELWYGQLMDEVDFAPRSQGEVAARYHGLACDVCVLVRSDPPTGPRWDAPARLRSGDKSVVEVLRKAMYGTRDAPQTWTNARCWI